MSSVATTASCGVTIPCRGCVYDGVEWEEHPYLISGRFIVFVIREGRAVASSAVPCLCLGWRREGGTAAFYVGPFCSLASFFFNGESGMIQLEGFVFLGHCGLVHD